MKDYPILHLDTNLQLFSRRVMNSSLLFGTHHFPPKKLQRMHQWDSSKLYPTTNKDLCFKVNEQYFYFHSQLFLLLPYPLLRNTDFNIFLGGKTDLFP